MEQGLFDADYRLARRGQLWMVVQQDPDEPPVLGDTSFDETAPLLLIKRTAGQTDRLILKEARMWLENLPGGGVTHFIIRIYDQDMQSGTSGTLISAVNPHMERVDDTPGFEVYASATALTASATGANFRQISHDTPASAQGGGIETLLSGSVAIGSVGSILIWAYAGTTAPRVRPNLKLVQEQIRPG